MPVIRALTPADENAVWPLLRDVFRKGDTYAVDPSITRDAALAYWKAGAACLVVEDAGQIVGTYYIKTNQPGGGAHICNCGYIVSTAARGRGLARLMCETSQDQARGLGYRAMQFNFVLESNAGALRLWHRLGFQTVGTIPDAFDHPALGMVAAQVLYKPL
ncbi:GNAT family N-acetyltransferase [Yoonia sp. 208BN28-4]|uniref:GNAT family N-acetyltransferase n=1 Tax=Yoonia sp. 208BN28-4 TaxID=3126505 RepID=UPI0030977638